MKIKECKLTFNRSLEPRTKDLISKLLTPSPIHRLKEAQVMSHEYFYNIDWSEWKKIQAPDWKLGGTSFPALFNEEPNLFDDF